MVDTLSCGGSGSNPVRVRVSSCAPLLTTLHARQMGLPTLTLLKDKHGETMPIVGHKRLLEITDKLLQCAGASSDESEIIARHVIGANLAGHDSHGIIQIPTYIDRVKRGHIIPGAPFDIVQETPSTTVADGHWGFGYVVSEHVMRMTIELSLIHI